MKSGKINIEHFNIQPNKPDGKIVSYSQFSTWLECPLRWKLIHVDKLRKIDYSIYTVFGDAIHQCLQEWLDIFFKDTIKKSESIDFAVELKKKISTLYLAAVEKNSGQHFSTPEELSEFFSDGVEMLNWIRKKRKLYFDKKKETFIGSEIALSRKINESGPYFMAYIDLVLKNNITSKYRIIDIKTSTRGWSEYDKKNDTKIAQVLLYKWYFAEEFNIPIDDINVEYMILKRKIDIDSAYPQKRVQTFVPAQKKPSYLKIKREFDRFIEQCFSNGEYRIDDVYVANEGLKGKNCKFCEFIDNYDRCPKSKRVCLE